MKRFFSKKMVAAIVVATILFLVIKPKTTYLIYVEGTQFACVGNEIIEYKAPNNKYVECFKYDKYQKEEGVCRYIEDEKVPTRFETKRCDKNATIGEMINALRFPPITNSKYHNVKVKDITTLCNIEYIKTIKTYREYFYYPKTILRWLKK